MLAEIYKLLRRLPWWRPYWWHKPVLPVQMPAPSIAVETPLEPNGNGGSTWNGSPAPVLEEYAPELIPPIPDKPKRTMPWAGKERGPYEMAKLRKAVAAEVDTVLQRFESLARAGMLDTAWKHRQMDLVQELLGNDFLLYDDDLKSRMKGGDKYSGIDNVNTAELVAAVWPLNFGFVGYYPGNPQDEDNREIGHVAMQWIHTVDPGDFRGRLRLVVPRMVQIIDARFGDNEQWKVDDHIYGLIGSKWVQLDVGIKRERNVSTMLEPYMSTKRAFYDQEWMNKVITTAMAEQLEARYQWHVAFGTQKDGPRIMLPTNPSSALKLFRDRAPDPSTDRRSKLRHWVEKHYREIDDDHGTTIYVRDHLRGNTQFEWWGYDSELMVSQYDLEKNELFRAEAEQWRAQRQHNRFKVRMRKSRKH
jgi:hypothetical protein